MNKCLLFLLFFLWCGTTVLAQISGRVHDGGKGVGNVRLTLKSPSESVAYTFSDPSGNFSFPVAFRDSLSVTSAHLSYEPHTVNVTAANASALEISLVQKVEFLEEVIIQSNLPTRQKRDTLVYNIEHFKDGSEKVIEDLLKKLPGVDVEPGGKIRYQGREISALTLDGEDVFKSGYAIGSKNLDIGYVEGVEAIENYNKDRILHKITRTNDVALNLKLKKGIPVLSARGKFENDFHRKYDNSVTALLLGKSKGFSTTGLNNIGNQTEEDLNVNNFRADWLTRPLLPEGVYPRAVETQNAYLNRTLLTSNSLNLKVSEQLSTDFNVSYYNDRLDQQHGNVIEYNTGDNAFLHTHREFHRRKPKHLMLGNHMQFYNGDNVQITTALKAGFRESEFYNQALNNGVARNNGLGSESRFVSARTEFTRRIALESAFKVGVDYQFEQWQQLFWLSPEVALTDIVAASDQTMDIGLNRFEGRAEYYNKWKNFKFKIVNTARATEETLDTKLGSETEEAAAFSNDLSYRQFLNDLTAEADFRIKRIKFVVKQTLWFHHANTGDEAMDDWRYLFSAEANFRLAPKHNLRLTAARTAETPGIDRVFKNPILTSHRTLSYNDGTLGNIGNTQFQLSYSILDAYNTFFFKSWIARTLRDKDYYHVIEITPQMVYQRAFLSGRGNDQTTVNVEVDKLIPRIYVHFKYRGSYLITDFYNYVNDSDLRSVKSHSFAQSLSLHKTFFKRLTLQNNFRLRQSRFSIDGGNSNHNNSLENDFTAFYKFKSDVTTKTSLSTFIADLDNRNPYHFLNAEVSYYYERLNCQISLRGQNLLNHKTFTKVSISDYAVYSTSHQLQERTVLLGLLFKMF